MRIAVIGAGAVGGYFGGRLAQAGEEVIFVARGDHLRAMRCNGLQVASIAGDFQVNPTLVTDNPSDAGTVDAILVAVKSWQIGEVARQIRPMVGPETIIVPLLNGVEAPTQLRELLDQGQVLGGLCRILSTRIAPGHIRHSGVEPYAAFGSPGPPTGQRARQLLKAFRHCTGVVAEIPADIRVAMWRKFVLVAAWSGVGALTRAAIGDIRGNPENRQLLERACEEVYMVAIACQVPLASTVVQETLNFVDTLPAAGATSMQRDILNGLPSELESLSGAVVRLGCQTGVAVPTHSRIYQGLLPLESRARSRPAPSPTV